MGQRPMPCFLIESSFGSFSFKKRDESLALLLLVQAVEQIPDTQHVLDTQGTVILTVTGAAVTGTFLPQLTAVVRTDAAIKAAVMVGTQDLNDAGLAAAIAVCGLAEIAILEVMDVADMGERDTIAIL